VYAFKSPDDPNTITIIANYIPFESPVVAPNYDFNSVRYEIHGRTKPIAAGTDVHALYVLEVNEDPTTFFYIRR
jgi:hypothetical protein